MNGAYHIQFVKEIKDDTDTPGKKERKFIISVESLFKHKIETGNKK